MFLNLAAYNICTEAEGPRKRFALWCQGCLKRCEGCCNPHMQEIKPCNIISCDEVISLIKKSKIENGITGVTFVGGEPLLQAKGLAVVARECKKMNLSVLLFTGYTKKELKADKLPGTEELLNYVDILVDGPFVKELYDNDREWVGSKNQQVLFLTDFYKSGVEFENPEKIMEFRIGYEEIKINGWPFELI